MRKVAKANDTLLPRSRTDLASRLSYVAGRRDPNPARPALFRQLPFDYWRRPPLLGVPDNCSERENLTAVFSRSSVPAKRRWKS